MAELLINDRVYSLPIVHLTSDSSSDHQKKRQKQLESLFELTEVFPDGLISGDFNFGDGEEQDAVDWRNVRNFFLKVKKSHCVAQKSSKTFG